MKVIEKRAVFQGEIFHVEELRGGNIVDWKSPPKKKKKKHLKGRKTSKNKKGKNTTQRLKQNKKKKHQPNKE